MHAVHLPVITAYRRLRSMALQEYKLTVGASTQYFDVERLRLTIFGYRTMVNVRAGVHMLDSTRKERRKLRFHSDKVYQQVLMKQISDDCRQRLEQRRKQALEDAGM